MQWRLTLLVFSIALAVQAQMRMSVDQLAQFVRSELALKQSTDKQLAAYVKKIQLNEKLTDKTIEDLEAQGAGPKTVDALHALRDESAKLTLPPHDSTYSPSTASDNGLVQPATPSARLNNYQPIPPPDSVRQAEMLDAIKQYASTYTKSLPDFVCVQVTRRFLDPSNTDSYRSIGTILTKLSYVEGHEDYKVFSVNNKYVDTTMDKIGGLTSEGEFGSMMVDIFDPKFDPQYAWDHWATLRGKRVAVFSYIVGRTNYELISTDQHVYVRSKGLIYADPDTGAIFRLKLDCIEIPKSFPVLSSSVLMDYADVDIDGRPYICPLRAEVLMNDGRSKWKLGLEFRAYRKFGTDSNIVYGAMSEPEPLPSSQSEEQPASSSKASSPSKSVQASKPKASSGSDPWTLPTPPPPPPQ